MPRAAHTLTNTTEKVWPTPSHSPPFPITKNRKKAPGYQETENYGGVNMLINRKSTPNRKNSHNVRHKQNPPVTKITAVLGKQYIF